MQNINADEAYKKLYTNNQKFVDVRTPGEFEKGHIEGAINIPLDDLEENFQKQIPDKSTPIYVYCLSGSRSIIAAGLLDNWGYLNVFNLESGLLSWRYHKFPLVTE